MGQALLPTYSVILTFVIMVAVLAVRPQGDHGEVRLMQMLSRMQWANQSGCACLPPEPALPAADLLDRQHSRPCHRLRHRRHVADLPGQLWRLRFAGPDHDRGHCGLYGRGPGADRHPARQSLAALLGADPACRGRRNAGGRNRRADRRADPRDLPVDDHAGAGCRLQPVRPIQHRLVQRL